VIRRQFWAARIWAARIWAARIWAARMFGSDNESRVYGHIRILSQYKGISRSDISRSDISRSDIDSYL
jgi:hypothetical protein